MSLKDIIIKAIENEKLHLYNNENIFDDEYLNIHITTKDLEKPDSKEWENEIKEKIKKIAKKECKQKVKHLSVKLNKKEEFVIKFDILRSSIEEEVV